MPYIHASPRRSPPTTTTAAAVAAPTTTSELKNSNNAGLALAGVPRRRLNMSFPGFPAKGTQAAQTAPTATTPTAPDAQTSILPTPDSSARSTPSPTTEVPRTASPARKPIFNVGSPKDDHKSYFDALKHSSSSGSGSSTSDSEEDADMPRFNRLNFNGRDIDGLAQCRERIDAQEKPSEDITPRSRPANTLPADAAKERERDSGFFELPSSTAPSQQSTPTPDAPRGGKPPALDLTGIRDAVPFPKGQGTESPPVLRGAPYTFPNVDGPPSPSVLPRTPSTPIILSNGKPLKSSLKSSASSPNFAPMHTRTRSAPTTPGVHVSSDPPTPKNVHFPTRNEELQKVRLFRPAGRPTAVSFDGGAEETETETEGYESSGYPFPVTPAQPQQETIVTLNTGLTSPVPRPSATHASGGAMYANVHLETMQLPKTRPYTLVGSVLVRNVAYNKSVAIRFTMDDWQTTSEVTAHYVSSLPSLPPPFHESRSSPLVGDAITSLSHASVGWDRFGWQVKLEDVTERRLAEKTMYLVVRYQAHGDGGGEWWDNNSGANYRVVFRKEAVTAPTKPTAGPLGPGSSSATRQLAHQIRAENRSGGLPPLQLKAKRPSLSTNWSFGNAPRNVGGTGRAAGGVDFGQPTHHESHTHHHHNGHGHHAHHAASNGHKSAPHSPASPKLSLKNYCPPTSPKSPPPSVTSLPSLTASITQQPSPPRSPVRTSGPTLELTTREVLTENGVPISVPVPIGASGPTVPLPSTTSEAGASGAAANGRLPPNLVLPARPQVDFSRGAFGGSEDNSPSGVMSPIGSPGTNASYEALVKQWCFGGSSNAVGAQAGGFADQSQHASAGFMSRGFNSGRLVGVGEMA